MEDPLQSAYRVRRASESPNRVARDAAEYPIASKIGAGVLGFLSGAAFFGAAFFGEGDLIVPGLSLVGLVALMLLSVVVGALAGRKWRGAILVQVIAMSPYVALLMAGEPQSLYGRLSYPVVLWVTSALGIYVGSKVGKWANAA